MLPRCNVSEPWSLIVLRLPNGAPILGTAARHYARMTRSSALRCAQTRLRRGISRCTGKDWTLHRFRFSGRLY